MVTLEDAVTKAVGHATRAGASDCDVVGCSSRYIVAEIEKGSMKQASASDEVGIGIRAFINGSSGFSYCADLKDSPIRRMAELAVSLAKGGTPDPDFRGLPEPEKVSKVSGLFDKRIASLGADEVVDMAIHLAEVAGSDRRITSVNALVAVGLGTACLMNSREVSAYQQMSSFDAVGEVVAGTKSDMFSGTDVRSSRKLDKPLLDLAGSNAREHAIMGLKKTRMPTGDYPVIMDPLAVGFLLASAVGDGANADSVQRGRSYLAGKLGKRIGSSSLSVSDDPTVEWASGSYSFDGEGTPARRKLLVDKGTLRTYLHDSYTSGKDSTNSTGNSSRGAPQWSFRTPPSISSSNLLVRPGTTTSDSMIEDVKNGIYLRLTWDRPNLTTGELSGLMMECYKISNGDLGASIRQSSMGISLLDMFDRIEQVGRVPREAFGVITPHLKVSKVRIGGSG